MSCTNPRLAIDFGIQENGKHKIKFLRNFESFENERSFYRHTLMLIPCGHCPSCRKDYARTWQARIMCESQYHEKSCFITLTYNDKYFLEKPVKSHLRKFIKDVRNKFGNGIKFFGCGELGENTKRSHYHLILFGVDFQEDAVITQKRGLHYIYQSKTADELWYKGFVVIGDLDAGSAGYVAQYCDKKRLTDEDNGEFLIMSRGLGRQYFEDHKEEIFKSDYLYFNGNKFKIPRYFCKLADKDFYYKFLADDYRERKKNVALNYRYNMSRSLSEEEAVQELDVLTREEIERRETLRNVGVF